MPKDIEEYRKVVGDDVVDGILDEAKDLSEAHVLNLNSTYR